MKQENEYQPILVRHRSARELKDAHAHLSTYLCECGKEFPARPGNIRTGRIKSCGCGISNRTHGMTNDKRYHVWEGIKNRCLNPNNPSYKNYGGRGIAVCEEWTTFEGFMKWDKFNDYQPGLQIDRIDNDKGYSPENCQWISHHKNTQNTRRTKLCAQKVLKVKEKYNNGWKVTDLAREFGVSNSTIRDVVSKRTWFNIL